MADFSLMGVLSFTDKTKAGTASAKKNIDGLKETLAAVKKVMAGLAIVQTVKLVAEFTKLGATADAVGKRFVALAGGEEEAARFLRAIREETGYTIDKMTAMGAASKYMSLGLADSADEAASLIGMAVRLGDQTQSTQQRIDDFGALLANQSTPRLDNFGISSENVRGRIAELQAQFVGMSREAAFNQAVLEQGAAAMVRLGDSAENQASSLEEAAALWSDFKLAVGTATADGIVPAVKGFNAIFNFIPKVNDALAENTESSLASGVAWEDYAAGQTRALLASGRAKGVIDELRAAMLEQGYSINDVNAALNTHEGVVKASVEMGMSFGDTLSQEAYAIQQAAAAADAGVASQRTYNEAMQNAALYTDDSATAFSQYSDALLATEEAAAAARDAQMKLDAATQAAKDSAAMAAIAFSDSAAALGEMSVASLIATQMKALDQAMLDGKISAEQLAEAQFQLLTQSGELTAAEASAMGAINSVTASFIAGKIGAEGMATAVLGVKGHLDNMPETVTVDFDFNIPALPAMPKAGGGEAAAFASGGTIGTNAPVLVGEAGPELISGASGARVIDNRRSSQVTNNFGGITVNSALGMERLLSESRRSRMMNVQV